MTNIFSRKKNKQTESHFGFIFTNLMCEWMNEWMLTVW